MTEAKHTPGPWVWQPYKNRVVAAGSPAHQRANGRSGVIVERISIAFKGSAERDANARLIAAAPEMLEALKAMVLNDKHTYRDCHKAALAAIAKAEGRQP